MALLDDIRNSSEDSSWKIVLESLVLIGYGPELDKLERECAEKDVKLSEEVLGNDDVRAQVDELIRAYYRHHNLTVEDVSYQPDWNDLFHTVTFTGSRKDVIKFFNNFALAVGDIVQPDYAEQIN